MGSGNFPIVLKRLRASKGMTQAELASALGIGKSTISMYEVGARVPDFEMLEAIADYFNVDMNTLTDKEPIPLINGDAELTEYLEELRNRPEQRLLFKTMKGATKAEIEAIVKMYEAMQGRGGKD